MRNLVNLIEIIRTKSHLHVDKFRFVNFVTIFFVLNQKTNCCEKDPYFRSTFNLFNCDTMNKNLALIELKIVEKNQ